MNKFSLIFTLLISAGLMGSASIGWAAPNKKYSLILERIAQEKQRNPKIFQKVLLAKEQMPKLARAHRGRLLPAALLLRPLGAEALWPMLEELSLTSEAQESTSRETLTGKELLSWRVGLLESVGSLRSPQAAPVLKQILRAELEYEVLRAASAALGNLGDDESVEELIRLSATAGPRQRGIIAGMGECRRLPAARALIRMLASHPDEELARELVKALGELGSAWAWNTPRLAKLEEGEIVGAEAAKALIETFINYDGRVRQAAETALLIVDSSRTPSLISAAKEKSTKPAEQAELNRLAERVKNSPLKTR